MQHINLRHLRPSQPLGPRSPQLQRPASQQNHQRIPPRPLRPGKQTHQKSLEVGN